MKTKFRFQLNLMYALLPIAMLFVLFTIAFNLCKLFGWFELSSTNPVFEISLLVFAFLIEMICAWLLFFSGYRIKKDCLSIAIGPIAYEIKGSNIVSLKVFSISKKLVLYFRKNDDVRFLVVNIKLSEYKDFIKAIRNLNSELFYDEIDEETLNTPPAELK